MRLSIGSDRCRRLFLWGLGWATLASAAPLHGQLPGQAMTDGDLWDRTGVAALKRFSAERRAIERIRGRTAVQDDAGDVLKADRYGRVRDPLTFRVDCDNIRRTNRFADDEQERAVVNRDVCNRRIADDDRRGIPAEAHGFCLVDSDAHTSRDRGGRKGQKAQPKNHGAYAGHSRLRLFSLDVSNGRPREI